MEGTLAKTTLNIILTGPDFNRGEIYQAATSGVVSEWEGVPTNMELGHFPHIDDLIALAPTHLGVHSQLCQPLPLVKTLQSSHLGGEVPCNALNFAN